MLLVQNLFVAVNNKTVINDFSCSINQDSITVCMGPNGSGKSSLAYTLAGHPSYAIAGGQINFNDAIINDLSPDKRARLGVFLSQQYPPALPGVTIESLLKESFRALYPQFDNAMFQARLKNALQVLQLEKSVLQRAVHDGFSGGQKKRCELLQLLVLSPRLAILDEIDSGLDVDSLQVIGTALRQFKKDNPESSLLIITHYQKLLDYLVPDQVLVMQHGKLIKTGGSDLIEVINKGGYEQFG
jgi:Fe-S cluster assembly ATP-binding protein